MPQPFPLSLSWLLLPLKSHASNTLLAQALLETYLTKSQYGVCVFRSTGLDDTRHVEFTRLFGELDDIRPYLTGGRKAKFPYVELFDAGNLDDAGNVIGVESQRAHYNRVRSLSRQVS